MSDQPALEVHGVSKRYGTREALCEIDLVARPGELHGLLGPNGAGKTTLMRIVLGLIRRDAGSVRLLGRDTDATGAALLDGVAGFVDTPAFYPYLSGRRNLSLLATLDGVRRSERSDRVARALEDVGLTAHAEVAVGGYSAGMRQRLGFAAALLRAPRLFVLDEPTSSLDPAAAHEVRALARRVADAGAAVVWSSHDMSEVQEICSVITVIDLGRVIFCGTVEDLRRRAPAAVNLMHTSNDGIALDLAFGRHGLTVAPGADGGLEVAADVAVLDDYVLALGRSGVAVRSLERRTRSLESLFLELTAKAETAAVAS